MSGRVTPRAWLLVALVAGCYRSNGFAPCAIACDPDGSCPSGTTCVAHTCVGPSVTCGPTGDASPDGPLPIDSPRDTVVSFDAPVIDAPDDSGRVDDALATDAAADAPHDAAADAAVDAAIDASVPPDACISVTGRYYSTCYGGSDAITFPPGGATPYDTSACGGGSLQPLKDGRTACVIVAAGITVNAVRVIQKANSGSLPLVLVATTKIAVNGDLDAASKQAPTPSAGAGADTGIDCTPNTSAQSAAAGLPGATFGGRGGDGGSAGAIPGGAAAPINTVDQFRGGCPSVVSTAGLVPTPGGGAIYLLAGQKIAVNSATIAVGGAGAPGNPGAVGGAGGASGGMIVLEAPAFAGSGSFYAGGGGGAEGGTAGGPGGDAIPPTSGGAGGGQVGGACVAGNPCGGAGGAFSPGTGQDGFPGTTGGGGGGGTGVIRFIGGSPPPSYVAVPAALITTTLR